VRLQLLKARQARRSEGAVKPEKAAKYMSGIFIYNLMIENGLRVFIF